MFTGYLLSESSRQRLLSSFPPRYERFIGEHITEQFGVSKDTPPPALPTEVKVVGHIDSGDGVEGLLVSVDGRTDRPDGSKYHITWSLSTNRKPAETNKYVDTATPVEPIAIDVTSKNFSDRHSLKTFMRG